VTRQNTNRWFLALVAWSSVALTAACGGDAVLNPPRDPGPLSAGEERWSDPATWGGRLPPAGGDVVIAAGRRILLDVSPPPLGSLRIDGRLRFDPTRDIELTAQRVTLSHPDARLQAGATDAPHATNAVLTLSGPIDTTAPEGECGAKGLCVVAGALELHGAERTSWTRLGATARRGATGATLVGTANWRPGDRVVIASTDFDMTQAEEVTLTRVDGPNIEFVPALHHEHFGEVQRFDDKTVENRAEVASLTRNVVIRSDATAAADGSGGHVLIQSAGAARLTNVALQGLGQRGRAGRHPLYFVGLRQDGRKSFVRDSVIAQSHNRCIALAATDRLTIERSVCYDHVGNGFHLDGGTAVDNVFVDNLGLVTRAPVAGQAVLAAEQAEAGGPATFFVSNPRNRFHGNVAAGSANVGFWFSLPAQAVGVGARIAPGAYGAPTSEWKLDFHDNLAHSNRGVGVHQDNCLQPDGRTAGCYWGPIREQAQALGVEPAPSDARLRVSYGRITAYKNSLGIGNRGHYMRYTDVRLADNGAGMVLACNTCEVLGGVIAGETANRGNPAAGERTGPWGHALPSPRAREFDQRLVGFRFYDERVSLRNVSFARFMHGRLSDGSERAETAAISVNPTDAAGHSAAGIRFVDVPAAARIGLGVGGSQFAFADLDGSVTGSPSAVSAEAGSLADASCELRIANGSHARSVRVCPRNGARFRFIDLWWQSDSFARGNAPVSVTRIEAGATAGSFTRTWESRLKLDLGVPVRLAFRDGAMTAGSTLNFSGLLPGDRFVLQVPFARAPSQVAFGGAYFGPMTGRHTALHAATSLAELAPNTWWFDAQARLLHIHGEPHYLDYAFNDGYANLTVH